jgi:hypothetical protein
MLLLFGLSYNEKREKVIDNGERENMSYPTLSELAITLYR